MMIDNALLLFINSITPATSCHNILEYNCICSSNSDICVSCILTRIGQMLES